MRLALSGFACAAFFLPVVEKTIFGNSFQTWHNTPLVCKWKQIQVCLGALKRFLEPINFTIMKTNHSFCLQRNISTPNMKKVCESDSARFWQALDLVGWSWANSTCLFVTKLSLRRTALSK